MLVGHINMARIDTPDNGKDGCLFLRGNTVRSRTRHHTRGNWVLVVLDSHIGSKKISISTISGINSNDPTHGLCLDQRGYIVEAETIAPPIRNNDMQTTFSFTERRHA